MKQFTLLIAIILISLKVMALDIPQGTFYFDNSKTQYSSVKFVYGSDSNAETYVISMTKTDKNHIWAITINERVENMYRYTFANTSLPDGKINDTFPNVKEYISKTLVENRTATTDKPILVGGTFTPETGDNWAQGYWVAPNADNISYSGTLPVMYINTENGASIVSKDDYINATYYVDALGLDRYESIGSETDQQEMEIRGRGNYTWTGFDKKPYRIKLGAKTKILGMSKSKHFALLAHADDSYAFLRNTVGFELSRRLGLKFTPAQQPVEVVLNGDYIGLYMLTETVRVDANRVNIVEQEDYVTDPNLITGGWLVEIDNYEETEQVRITEGNGSTIRFTYKTPELLSDAQRNYLTNQVTAMNNAIYNSNKNSTSWEGYIDIDSLARFYIVQEIMDNAESFHGSCYMHKDKGLKKWIFGPVWDFGNSYQRGNGNFIYENPPFGQTWIGEIAKFPRFQNKVVEVWKNFKGNNYDTLNEFIDNFIEQIAIAAQHDYYRWPSYGASDPISRKNEFKRRISERVSWLVEKWGEGESGIENIINDNILSISILNGCINISSEEPINGLTIFNLTGKIIKSDIPNSDSYQTTLPSGIYILNIKTSNRITNQKLIIR